MGYFKQRCDLFRRTGNSFSVTPVSFVDFFNYQIHKGTADAKDTFSFSVINSNNKHNADSIAFKIGDKIKIYMWKNSADPSNTDLLMDGFITNVSQTISDKGKVIQISGKNVLEFLFSTPILFDSTSLGDLTAPYLIKSVIDELNRLNKSVSSFQIRYTGPSADGSISTLLSIKSAITKTNSNVKSSWKNASVLIEDFSKEEYTGDSLSHMAYTDIDSNGNLMFYWQPRTSDEDDSITEGIQPSMIKTSYKDEVINAVIANCGVDPNNNGITVFVANYSSITKNGTKWKYDGTNRDFAENLMQREIDLNPSDFDADSGWYPKDGSFPYTTEWGEECATKAAYKTAIRVKSQTEVKAKVLKQLTSWSNPKFTSDVELAGIPNQSLGSYIPHNIASYNVTDLKLRLVNLSHSFWSSTIKSEEDAPSGVGIVG